MVTDEHTTAANGVNGTNSHHKTAQVPSRLYSISNPPSLSSFIQLCSQSADASRYPHAEAVTSNIPIYDLSSFPEPSASLTRTLQDEWHDILLSGPGVVVLRNLQPDLSLLDRVNKVFSQIIESEASTSKGDHFAASGNNSRIWNSFQKHALAHPGSFVQYYANPWLARVCECWLGPAYQVTAQVNIVRPGGKPQVSHRDYHLGFQTAAQCAAYPRAMQVASQLLTLQGAVAHSDMPLASGPTRFLPFSQRFEEGFMAYRLAEFQEYFDGHWVSLPLRKGDAVFFNPALFHAAGENQTADVERSANLLQISSAFGRTMESIDSLALVERCWSEMRGMFEQVGMSESIRAIVAAVGEGYPFPTNLDKRPPAPRGMAPESEVEILLRGLNEGWDTDRTLAEVSKIRDDSRP